MSGGRTWRTATSVTKKFRKVISARNAQGLREPSQARGNRHQGLPAVGFLSTASQRLPFHHSRRHHIRRHRPLRGSPSLDHLQYLRRRRSRHRRHSPDRCRHRRCRHLRQPSVARHNRPPFRTMKKPEKQRRQIFLIQIMTADMRVFRHSRVNRRLPDQ